MLRRLLALLFIVLAASACRDGDAPTSVPPGDGALSGRYTLDTLLYVVGTDTARMTDDSYLRLDFSGDEVTGEGLVFLGFRMKVRDGGTRVVKRPVFGERGRDGKVGSLRVAGHYRVQRDTLDMTFWRGEGKDTWLEAPWTMKAGADGFVYEQRTSRGNVRIVFGRGR